MDRLLRPEVGVFGELRGGLRGPGIAIVSRYARQGQGLCAVQELGVRVADRVTVGSEGAVADFLAYFAGRVDVGAIAVYLEGVREGRGLLLALDHAARRGVPVVALTAADGGADRVLESGLRQFGVVRVDAPDELQDIATLFARTRRPAVPAGGDRVAVHAAPPGQYFAELVAAAGLSVVQESLDSALDDPAVGVLVCPIPASAPPLTDALAQDLVAAAERTDKPVCVVWGSPVGTEPAYRETLLGSSRVITFRTYGNCVAAIRAYLEHRRFTTPYRSPFDDAPRTPSPSLRKARPLLKAGQRLSEHAAKQLLRAYGVRVPREQLVTSAAAAVRAAGQVGYPVVLKASAPRLARRTELGLIRLGLTSAGQVRDAYRDLTAIARYEGLALDGVLVCQMVERGVELMARVTHDDRFGPVVTVGLGGPLEPLRDTAVRIPPFGERDARAMLGDLTCHAVLLDGTRDADALVEVLLRIQRLALELGGDLAELTIDPLVALDRGQGAVALAALAVCR